MKTKQVNPMPAFIGTHNKPCGFDCEFAYNDKNREFKVIGNLSYMEEASYGSTPSDDTWDESESYVCQPYDDIFDLGRPRLNEPQVLPDWGWLNNPLLDGFVWEVRWFNEIAEMLYTETVNSKKCFEIATHDLHDFLQAEIKGVQKGSQLEDWAIENDVPIYNDDMEVVK